MIDVGARFRHPGTFCQGHTPLPAALLLSLGRQAVAIEHCTRMEQEERAHCLGCQHLAG